MDELKAGVYRHYKGPLYLVLGLAHDANADELADYPEVMRRTYAHNRGDEDVPNKPVPLGEREVVVYVGLQLDSAHTGARLAVRTVDDFFAWVHPDGTRCDHQLEGLWCGNEETVPRQRFAYVGARWDG